MTILLFSLLSFITGAVAPGEPQRAELLFVGDAMQHQAQLDRARELGGDCYDYSDCFTYIAPEITAADYAVCNLEVPLGGGRLTAVIPASRLRTLMHRHSKAPVSTCF